MEIKCEVMRLKKSKIKDYINMHLNPWPEIMEEIKNSEIIEEYVFIIKNIVIVIIKANDVINALKILRKKKECKKWSKIVKDMISLDNTKLPKLNILNAKCIFSFRKEVSKK